MPSADFCAAITTLANRSVPLRDTTQASRGKTSRLHRTPAEFTTPALDGPGLRDHWLARPAGQASYPVLVHRVAALLHASFRPCLATSPLRFANTSPPSGWIGDSHPHAAGHARHTKKAGRAPARRTRLNMLPGKQGVITSCRPCRPSVRQACPRRRRRRLLLQSRRRALQW